MKKWKVKIIQCLALLLVMFNTLLSPITALANSREATVTYKQEKVKTVQAKQGSRKFETYLVPIQINGILVFCLEPDAVISNENEPGYIGNPANGEIPRRALLAMSLWDEVLGGTSDKNYYIAQTVVWMNLEGKDKAIIDNVPGIPDLKEKQDKLNQAITDYENKPSFDGQSYQLKLNEPVEIKNTNAQVDLQEFDRQVTNTGNLDVQVESDKLIVTATDASKTSGVLRYQKSRRTGTPYIYKKKGQQTVGVGRIEDPGLFNINFTIQATGAAKIMKVDEDTGAPVPGTTFRVEFFGENAPSEQTITTGHDGSYTLNDIPAGVHVRATEIEVPEPYILASTLGKTDTVEGTVRVGETLTLTQENTVAKGQIKVQKRGDQSGQEMWNEHYTLEGNVFEIRQGSQDGAVVETITTNGSGYAETSTNLKLGNYWIVETQASNGFAKTFEPVEVVISYADQTTEVVIGEVEGTNKEVTGQIKVQKRGNQSGQEMWNEHYTLEGNVFEIRQGSQDGEVVETITTNGSGYAETSTNLKLGNYWIVETQASNGFAKTFEPVEVVMSYENQSTEIVIHEVEAPNKEVTGQIKVQKRGNQSGQEMWNEHYTLEGNVFEIRQGSQDGEVVETITTNGSGYAETSTNLKLGNYWVVETHASNGFVNTFEPVEVALNYENESTEVVIRETEGTNQEVTGKTVLIKQDEETGSEPQGKSTLKGAEYTLFNDVDQPVKWNLPSAPTLVSGKKKSDEHVVIQVDDETLQVGVERLPLGNYYWKETKAPEGYQIDSTKHQFNLTYKDQETAVIVDERTSHEKVIKFNVDGFKYVTSVNKSAQTGYNDIEFNLTPLDGTNGETRTSISRTDQNGYDGYWDFSNIPYGDYRLTEKEAPEGYKLIQPLTIQSSYNAEKKEYTFVISEEGQKEPLKVKTISAETIDNTTNIVSLSKLFLYNDAIEEEEPASIQTLFVTTKDGKQVVDGTIDNALVDKVTMTVPASKVGADLHFVTQFHKVSVGEDGQLMKDASGNIISEVVNEVNVTQQATAESFEFDVPFELKAGTLKHGERLVATHVAYEDKAHEKEYARHYDLENNNQTVTIEKPAEPEADPTIETLFVTAKDGKQVVDGTIDNALVDKVTMTVPASKVGADLHFVTQFHKVSVGEDGQLIKDASGNIISEVVNEVNVTQQATAERFEFDVPFELKSGTLKYGERLVATHVVYEDEAHKKEYARHYDLENEKQTITVKQPEQPKQPKLPKTGEHMTEVLAVFGVLGLMTILGSLVYRKKFKK